MIFSILLLVFLLFEIKSKKISKIITAIFLSVYQLITTVFLARIIDLEGINASLFFYDKSWFSWKVFGLSFIVSLVIGCLVKGIHSLIKIKNIEENQLSLKKAFLNLSLGVPIFLSILCYSGASWIMNEFGNVGIEEIIYTMSQPLKGTDKGQIVSFIEGPLLDATFIIFSFVCVLELFSIAFKFWVNTQPIAKIVKRIFLVTVSIGTLFIGIVLGIQEIGYADIKAYFFEKTTIYEDYFVDPSEVDLLFPEKKRNLIYIFVESLETTYLSKDLGGAQEENLLPNLSKLAQEKISFSQNSQIGGGLSVPGTGFTVGAMVGQTTGVPLKVMGAYAANDYGATSSYMPGVISLGDILEKEGYHQELFIGSDAGFAGRDKYFSQHGNYEIIDYNYAKEEEWIPKDYEEWWGYEDEKLFPFAKERLSEMAESEEPFNFTLLTADTHFPDGYMGANTPKIFKNQYSNVIHYTDTMLMDFIRWIQEQPFYDNTTIILTGDHLSMDTEFFADLDSGYQRTIFNLFLNTPYELVAESVNSKNREFCSLDLFPTTLAALGVEIEGNRLGLGTNLLSTKSTLIEDIGYETFTEELRKNSPFYNSNIMQGSDLEVGKISEN